MPHHEKLEDRQRHHRTDQDGARDHERAPCRAEAGPIPSPVRRPPNRRISPTHFQMSTRRRFAAKQTNQTGVRFPRFRPRPGSTATSGPP